MTTPQHTQARVEALKARVAMLRRDYWERRPGWTRAGDVLHKHAVAGQLRKAEGQRAALEGQADA